MSVQKNLLLLAAVLLWSACDTVEPVGPPRLVVEAFLDAGKPLPTLVLRQTRPIGDPYPDDPSTAAEGADVRLTLGGTTVAYRPVPGQPGRYAPAGADTAMRVPARAPFTLAVTWEAREALAEGTVPPPIVLDSIDVDVPVEPVPAVLLDSLFSIDSLVVQKGFIYPVEVTLWWTVDFAEVGADSVYWVETDLRPRTSSASSLDEVFLQAARIVRERTMPRDATGRRSWTGVYAVPVASVADPLPPHQLRVSLLRSGQAYARFASSRDAPERREPVTNVEGGLGIVAGVSVDSVTVWLEHGRGARLE